MDNALIALALALLASGVAGLNFVARRIRLQMTSAEKAAFDKLRQDGYFDI